MSTRKVRAGDMLRMVHYMCIYNEPHPPLGFKPLHGPDFSTCFFVLEAEKGPHTAMNDWKAGQWIRVISPRGVGWSKADAFQMIIRKDQGW